MKFGKRNILFVLCSISVCFASDNIPISHRGILKQVTRSAVTTAVEDTKSLSLTAVSFFTDSTTASHILRNDILEVLLQNEITVYTGTSTVDTTFSYTIDGINLSYGEAFTESMFGSRKVERTISVMMNVTVISEKQQKIVYSKNITASNIDTVLYVDVENLQDPTLPIRTLSQPQLSFFDSFLEPAIVTIASAVAIYLFFTIRS